MNYNRYGDQQRTLSGDPQQRRALLVVNARSRNGQGGIDAAANRLRSGGIHLLQEECRNADELSATIRRRASSVNAVVLGGGDGTLNSAAPALIETGLPLGILPLGTAN